MKGTITVDATDDANKRSKKLVFKNNARFGSCISNINNTLIENAEEIHATEINEAGNYRTNNRKTATSKYFEYETK